jgi:hypothetical protein
MATPTRQIPLTTAAMRLGKSWERTWRMVLNGELVGEKQNGRWLVSEESVERLAVASGKSRKPADGPTG